MTIRLAVVNRSSLVSLSDALRMTAACAAQLRLHACPAWRLPVPEVELVDAEDLEMGVLAVGLFDSAAEAAGEGCRYSAILVEPILRAGGGALTGEGAVSAALSAELLAVLGDPSCTRYLRGQDGCEHALELSAPVEPDSYDLHGVSVASFILPSWLGISSTPGEQVDYMHRLARPLELGRSGYDIVRCDGQLSERLGARYLERRRLDRLQPASRAARRLQRR